MHQPSLLDPEENRMGQHHFDGPDTEFEAAVSVYPTSGTMRKRVLDAIVASGSFGMTDHELVAKCNIPLSSVCARRNELKGWVEATDRRRVSPYGKECIVYVATKAARERQLGAGAS